MRGPHKRVTSCPHTGRGHSGVSLVPSPCWWLCSQGATPAGTPLSPHCPLPTTGQRRPRLLPAPKILPQRPQNRLGDTRGVALAVAAVPRRVPPALAAPPGALINY